MKKYLLACLAVSVSLSLSAQKTISVENDADEVVKIWDNKTAPHSNHQTDDEVLKLPQKHFQKTSETVVYVYKANPKTATGQAIVVLPGGGYSSVCIAHEGFTLAKYYQSIGITAVVLKYRLPNFGNKIVPLEDAQEALRWTRKNAKRLNVDPKKVGICGSSAGGHLAAYTSNFTADYEKPAFSILFYPVITGTTWYTHHGTFENLLGKMRTPAEQEYYSLENRVTEQTPPTLLILADDDKVVPTISSINYYKALKDHGIKACMHIFPSGGHGFAGHDEYKYANEVKAVLADWLKGL